jgi:hypothetical protein
MYSNIFERHFCAGDIFVLATIFRGDNLAGDNFSATIFRATIFRATLYPGAHSTAVWRF